MCSNATTTVLDGSIITADNSLLLKDRSLSGLRKIEEGKELTKNVDTSSFLPLRSRKPVAAPVVL
jgi:hypothetical protein